VGGVSVNLGTPSPTVSGVCADAGPWDKMTDLLRSHASVLAAEGEAAGACSRLRGRPYASMESNLYCGEAEEVACVGGVAAGIRSSGGRARDGEVADLPVAASGGR